MAYAYCLFDTAIGTCALAWGVAGIRAVELPAKRSGDAAKRLRARLGVIEERIPDTATKRAIASLQHYLSGRGEALADIVVDWSGVTPFSRRVYQALQRTPRGTTMTYGELAAHVGSPGGARAVGRAMAKNPLPLLVPCHRVLGAGGAGGFSSDGGLAQKAQLLALEGVELKPLGRPPPFDATRAARALRQADAELATLIDRVGPPRLRLEPPRNTFAALAKAIVYQQLTGKAAATIFGRLRDNVGITPERVAAADGEALRAAGLSRAKQAALRDLAARTLAGEVPTVRRLGRMDDEAIVASLVNVRGIGRWTVEMLLIFQLGRPDVLPVGDYGVRKGYARAFGLAELPSPKALAERGERWRPWRSLASWYLWRATEL